MPRSAKYLRDRFKNIIEKQSGFAIITQRKVLYNAVTWRKIYFTPQYYSSVWNQDHKYLLYSCNSSSIENATDCEN